MQARLADSTLFFYTDPFSSASSCFQYGVISISCMLTTKHLTTGTQTFTFLNISDLEQQLGTALYMVRAYKTLTTLTFAVTLLSTNNPFRLISLSSSESSLQRHSFHAYQTPLLLRTILQWSERGRKRLGGKEEEACRFCYSTFVP